MQTKVFKRLLELAIVYGNRGAGSEALPTAKGGTETYWYSSISCSTLLDMRYINPSAYPTPLSGGTKSISGMQLLVGTSKAEPSEDDTTIPEDDRTLGGLTCVTATSQFAGEMYSTKHRAILTFQNNTDASVEINCTYIVGYSSNPYLLDHSKFDTPYTVAPGEYLTVVCEIGLSSD